MIEQTPNAPPAEATVQKTVEDCQRYRDKLYWRCRLYFRDWPDYAEDCVQEAYIELMQALRAGRCIHNYEAWLFKVAILKGQVMIREEKMRREMQFENSSDRFISPDMMQPPETIESTAIPRRSSSSRRSASGPTRGSPPTPETAADIPWIG